MVTVSEHAQNFLGSSNTKLKSCEFILFGGNLFYNIGYLWPAS